jgi:protein-tyrosine phosphatase
VTTSTDALSGAWNFRDVAEAAGIRPGRLYRSSELSKLDDAGGAALVRFGITDVADLRSPQEVERHGPGRVPAGVQVHLLPFHGPLAEAVEGEESAEAPHEQSFQRLMTEKPNDEDVSVAAKRFMTEEYERFPVLPGAHIAVRQVISMLADERSVITHCFAGKDRTGLTVGLVLESVGIGRDAVMADFLRSNDAVPQLRESILETIRSRAGDELTDDVFGFAETRLTDEVLGVHEDYLDAARRVIDAEYGSLPNYLAALGVTAEQLDRLRTTLRG